MDHMVFRENARDQSSPAEYKRGDCGTFDCQLTANGVYQKNIYRPCRKIKANVNVTQPKSSDPSPPGIK